MFKPLKDASVVVDEDEAQHCNVQSQDLVGSQVQNGFRVFLVRGIVLECFSIRRSG